MPQLPSVVWVAVAGFAGLLIALCILTTAIALRVARRRWARWPARRVVGFLVVAAVPWLIAWLAPLRIVASIHGTLQLIAWLLAAVLAFALLLLLPLTALITSVIWWRARRQETTRASPPG